METLYCAKCDGIVETEVRSIKENYEVRGEDISILANIVYCKNCNEQIFYEKLDNENLNQVYKEFRKRRGYVTPERIKAIRKKYGLSQRALGRLLKLDEVTINRYENGSLPSDAHNKLLISIEEANNVKKLLDQVRSDLPNLTSTNLHNHKNPPHYYP